MQLNTMLKLGSLAMNVAQDDNVKQLFTMIHKGAKRRGVIGATQPIIPQQNHSQNASGNRVPMVPFAPQPLPQQHPLGPNLSKYLTAGNAKKVLGWASDITNFLVK